MYPSIIGDVTCISIMDDSNTVDPLLSTIQKPSVQNHFPAKIFIIFFQTFFVGTKDKKIIEFRYGSVSKTHSVSYVPISM